MQEELPGHVIPVKTLFATYITLLLLTAIMIGLSRMQTDKMGVDWINMHGVVTAVIMSIAAVMGIIVAMVLMGLRYEHRALNLTIFASNFMFLFIFVLFTWVDTSFRGEIDPGFTQSLSVFKSPVQIDSAHAGASAEH